MSKENTEQCAVCQGTGKIKSELSHSGLHWCMVCGGSGKIEKEKNGSKRNRA